MPDVAETAGSTTNKKNVLREFPGNLARNVPAMSPLGPAEPRSRLCPFQPVGARIENGTHPPGAPRPNDRRCCREPPLGRAGYKWDTGTNGLERAPTGTAWCGIIVVDSRRACLGSSLLFGVQGNPAVFEIVIRASLVGQQSRNFPKNQKNECPTARCVRRRAFDVYRSLGGYAEYVMLRRRGAVCPRPMSRPPAWTARSSRRCSTGPRPRT